jgi:hypothetical protein
LITGLAAEERRMTAAHIARDFVLTVAIVTPFAVADIAALLPWATRS